MKWTDQTGEASGLPRVSLSETYTVTAGHILETAKEKIPYRPEVLSGETRYDQDRELQELKKERVQARGEFLDVP